MFSLRRREIFSVFVIETTVAFFNRQNRLHVWIVRQTKRRSFTLENSDNLTKEKRIFLQFIIVICNTNFAVVLVNFIENRVYSDIDFLTFYSRNLDEELDENIEINFLVLD